MAARALAALALISVAGVGALFVWSAREGAPRSVVVQPAGPQAASAPPAHDPPPRRQALPFEGAQAVRAPATVLETLQPPRDRPAFEGPLVATWYGEGRPEFAGAQVRDADGSWRLDGPWQAWHESGQVFERGRYVRGLEDGPWNWWYADGRPMAAGTWSEGRRLGRWTFWQENGALGAIGHYVDGEGDGPWTLYHENGRPWIAGVLARGEPVGLWQVWNEDGTLDPELTQEW